MATSSHTLLIFFTTIVLIGALMLLLRSSRVRGWIGEFRVNLRARFSLNRKTYHLLRNVTLPTEDDTTLIDHIIVSKFGIFVVETKQMRGRISGHEHDPEWTQQINNQERTFQNPLLQHERHTKALEEILGLMPNRVFSVIVFVGDNAFKTTMVESVTRVNGYIDYIKSKTEPLFGEFEVEEIVNKIKEYRQDPGLESLRKHLENLGNKYPGKIRRKLRKAKPASPVYKYAVIGAVLLVFAGVAQKIWLDGQDESESLTADEQGVHPSTPPEKSPTQQELNKIYQYQDAQGKTHYSNVPTARATLMDKRSSKTKPPLSIKVVGNQILVPVTIGNKGMQMETDLRLDEQSPVTILPKSTADFIDAGHLGKIKVKLSRDKKVSAEKRKADYFTVGDTTEPDFVFLATDDREYRNRGVLGMDFKDKYPFVIDRENQLLIWQ